MAHEEIQLPTDFASVTDEALAELEQVARAAAAPLAEAASSNGEFSDDDLSTLERLADVVKGAEAERNKRVATAATSKAQASRRSKAAEVFATKTSPTGDEGGETVEDADDETDTDKPDAKKRPGVAAIAASGGKTPAAPVEQGDREHYSSLVAAAGAAKKAGETFDDWDDVAASLEASMATYSNLPMGTFTKQSVLQVRRDYPKELRIGSKDTPDQVYEKFEYAASQARLPGQALVAAAGWCAPSQVLYDLYEIENGTDGMLDVPEIQVSRGGIQYTAGPDFSYIWGGSSSSPAWPQGYWHQTETQVQAATSKPTMVVPCPSFTNTRLEVDGVQITGAFLQDRGYPEMVARFSRGAMVVHNRRMNAFKLNAITDGSTLIDLTSTTNWPAASSESKDLTTVSRLLAAFGIQGMDYRYRYRMGLTDTLEAVLPYWVVEYVRADVQRRMNLDPDTAFQVSIAQLQSWFSARNMRLQLVYDWQDAFNQPTQANMWGTGRFTVNSTTNVGSPSTQIYTLPSTVYGLLFAPGTWVNGVSDVIRLDTVYDSTNLALNQYVQLFTEEGTLMAKRGYESRLIKVVIEPSGTTSATTSMTY